MRTTSCIIIVALCVLPASSLARRRSRQRTGFLKLLSTTERAEVIIDGELRGKTPIPHRIQLTTGKHTLKMKLRGYTQFLDVFTIRSNKTTTLDIDLLPVAGIFTVRANVPKARVFIDGKFIGLTPIEQEVLIGKRKIKVKKVGYLDVEIERGAIAGKTTAISVKLKLAPIGTPYRPPPPPPPEWYEKWYIWAGAAGGLIAIAVAVIVPVVLTQNTGIDRGSYDHFYSGTGAP